MKKSHRRAFLTLQKLWEDAQNPRADPYNKGLGVIRKHLRAATNDLCLRFLAKQVGRNGYTPPDDYDLEDVEEWDFHLDAQDFWISDENNHLWFKDEQ